jgi:hypothetical protein
LTRGNTSPTVAAAAPQAQKPAVVIPTPQDAVLVFGASGKTG